MWGDTYIHLSLVEKEGGPEELDLPALPFYDLNTIPYQKARDSKRLHFNYFLAYEAPIAAQ